MGIAVNSTTGDIYVGEATENKIRKYFKVGNSWEFIEWEVPAYPEDQFPNNMPRLYGSLAIDSSGYVYVADWGAHRIQKFDSNGKFITRWGSHGPDLGKFIGPTGIAVDPSDNIYVTDGNALQKFSNSGVPIYRIYRSDPKPPWGVTVDIKSSIYETYNYNNKVQKFAPDGSTLISSWGGSGNSEGQFGNGKQPGGLGPHGIDVNTSTGEVYVVDSANKRIQVFSPEFANGYYAVTERHKYDFHDVITINSNNNPNGKIYGMLKATRDALGYESSVMYDIFDLLPIEVIDPAGLTIKTINDYRVFQPTDIIDPNGNKTHYSFSPVGILESISILGKDNEDEGDTIDTPSTKYEYNFNAFLYEGYLFNWDEITDEDKKDDRNLLFQFLKAA